MATKQVDDAMQDSAEDDHADWVVEAVGEWG
jgi:hypothetical protein